MKTLVQCLLVLLISLLTHSAAGQQSCEPSWLPTFGGFPGISGEVRALAVFDDGSGGGQALYVGGNFTSAGGVSVSDIAKWDGANWQDVGGGVSAPNGAITVNALTVFDDGSGGGPALFAGGQFQNAGGVPANYIAKWDGTTWSPLGGGLIGRVNALTVFDDGNGSALYATGEFGFPERMIAKWDGTSWSSVGGGLNNGFGRTLTVYDDGSGPALYLGGFFSSLGGGATKRSIAKWDGTNWWPLGLGMELYKEVHTLAVFDDGSGGQALYAGGDFTTAGGVPANRIAMWDGTSWSSVGSGTDDDVTALAVLDDLSGGGQALFVGGEFTNAGGVSAGHIAKWDGATWSAVGGGMKTGASTTVRCMTMFDDGGGAGPILYAGGNILGAGSTAAIGIASWDGSNWSALGGGLNGAVLDFAVFDDQSGGGPALYLSGSFTGTGSVTANRVAKWDGNSWSPLGFGLSFTTNALEVFDDQSGGGESLYAANIDILKWNGTSWFSVGGGLTGGVGYSYPIASDLVVFDDGRGGGPALYVAGDFLNAGAVTANGIAKWNGTNWTGLDLGMGGTFPSVHALAVFDDGSGSGPALYAGGAFTTAGGVPTNRIARWDGESWSALSWLGRGLNGSVNAFAVFDDGGGEALYVGGSFTVAGTILANRIAKWDGTSWSRLGDGINGTVSALKVFDDKSGGGAALYAGGNFQSAGGVAANRIAKWNGASWSPVGTQGSGFGSNSSVLALEVFDDGGGSALFVGGGFSQSASGDSNVAKFGCEASPFSNFCTAKTSLVCGAANISAAGTPSATATSGFIIEAGPVRGCRPGLLLYSNQPTQPGVGFGGPGNGLLCLAGQGLRRAGPDPIEHVHAAMRRDFRDRHEPVQHVQMDGEWLQPPSWSEQPCRIPERTGDDRQRTDMGAGFDPFGAGAERWD